VHIFTAINIVNITGAIATFGTALYTSVQLGTNLKKIGKKEVWKRNREMSMRKKTIVAVI